jgi:hypothetical protein
MAIDHEAHKIRIKAVSDKMNHPMEYNDAGAPRMSVEQYSSKVKKEDAMYREKHGQRRQGETEEQHQKRMLGGR